MIGILTMRANGAPMTAWRTETIPPTRRHCRTKFRLVPRSRIGALRASMICAARRPGAAATTFSTSATDAGSDASGGTAAIPPGAHNRAASPLSQLDEAGASTSASEPWRMCPGRPSSSPFPRSSIRWPSRHRHETRPAERRGASSRPGSPGGASEARSRPASSAESRSGTRVVNRSTTGVRTSTSSSLYEPCERTAAPEMGDTSSPSSRCTTSAPAGLPGVGRTATAACTRCKCTTAHACANPSASMQPATTGADFLPGPLRSSDPCITGFYVRFAPFPAANR